MTTYAEAERSKLDVREILAAPSDLGTVELVVRRPAEGEREVLDEGVLDLEMRPRRRPLAAGRARRLRW